MPDRHTLLCIQALHAAYPDGTMALKGMDLSVPEGVKVALLGANGSGKTSLMLAVMGALPAVEGRVVVDGIEVGRKTLNDVRRRCGMVFQQADDQLFMPTLLEDAAFGPLNHGQSAHNAVELARKALADVGLAGLEGKSGHHLSDGQKRSASLATVLSMQVKLLLLDEPAANLDARSRGRLIALLRQRPETMLIATHDLPLGAALCDVAVVVSAGRIAAVGPCAEILRNTPLLQEHGLI